MDTADKRILRELDNLLRVVAPVEHPPGAAALVLTFADVGIGGDFAPPILGFSASNLDTYAADLRRDPSLVGRPVFVVSVERLVADRSIEAATSAARAVALHELAHAILARAEGPRTVVSPEDFPAWVRSQLTGTREELVAHPAHGPDWFRVYVYAVARLAAVAPRVVALERFGLDVETYGYGTSRLAREWIAAAQTDPGFFDCALATVPARECPAIDRLLASVRPQAESNVSAAATLS